MLLEPFAQIDVGAQEVRGRRTRSVPFVLEADHGGGDLQHAQGLVVLLGLGHRRAEVAFSRHQHGGRLDVADVHEGGAAQVLGGVVPGEFLEVAVPAGAVGGADERQPVGDGAVGGGRGEAVGVADDPRREHAAARAAVDEHVALVHVAALDHEVHAGHEVVEVLAGVGVLDRVAEGAAVA